MPERPLRRFANLIAGVIGFGVLMGLRELGPSVWVRSLIAGAAFAWLVALARAPKPAER